MKNKFFIFFIMVWIGLISFRAHAVAYSWDLTGSDSGYSSSITVTSSGHTVKATGYASANSDGTGALSSGYVRRYSGGIGISNCISGSSCNETSDPNHSIDTDGKNDFLLLEFDNLYDMKAFEIGWKGDDADIQVWVGSDKKGAGLNLSGACVTGCVNTLSSLGFTALPRFMNVDVDDPVDITAPNKSRYLLISGELGAIAASSPGNDYFKVSAITVGTPIPPTLALFSLALLGIMPLRKSKISGKSMSVNSIY